jgi:ABC-type Fe3+-hydroxamate transport system substrate-binding protein
MIEFIDQTGRKVTVPDNPKRIISVVPSQTELLYDLGLRDEVVGITKFCIHPQEWFHGKTRVGGTKKLDIEKIKFLNPDLIIANKEENTREQIEELIKLFPVWISDVKTLAEALNMIHYLGTIISRESEAKDIIIKIYEQFKRLSIQSYGKKVVYLIWKEPYMTVNADTFINDMIKRCGWENAFANHPKRYPEITIEDIQKAQPDIILLSSEPYPFKEKHCQELNKLLPDSTINLIDGELFSWYGSRLIKSPEYFLQIIKETE